ncbi:hypothetical protein [Tomitella fengzijianii]|uniref:HIRAN domain-containing protein n=1 Tax=Tomitella fengzijianii TaxID=2597660 RepID=A0A516X399_9ACTN|nr:hypothetical protein [Tomitella fengzijianii]QDQ97528.1 hypothetical protein FO059_09545 [Tomitella fengzijianii]
MPDSLATLPHAHDADSTTATELIVAWQNPHTRAIRPVGRLTSDGPDYVFSYLSSAPEVAGFRPIIGFPHFHRAYRSPTLFPVFSQRLMSATRPDFAWYSDILGLPVDAAPLTVLGRSTGRREGDSLMFIPNPPVAPDGKSTSTFFVHGLRHVAHAEAHLALCAEGDAATLRAEPDNPVNPRALLVISDAGHRIGWVPDLLLDYVHAMREHSSPRVAIAQINPPTAPPNLRLRITIHGAVTPGFEMFGSPTAGVAARG